MIIIMTHPQHHQIMSTHLLRLKSALTGLMMMIMMSAVMMMMMIMIASSASPAVIVITRFDWHASTEPAPILERSFSFLGLVHFCNNLVTKCAAVSAYSSAAAWSMCGAVAFAVVAHRRSPRKPASFLAASRGRDGSPIVARARCIFALLSRENAPLLC